jgi:hypothetical protein
MTPYKNLSGTSNIERYEITADSITVKFSSGKERNYLYTYQTPGAVIVEKMKALAVQGRGLNAYIRTTVKASYQSKW